MTVSVFLADNLSSIPQPLPTEAKCAHPGYIPLWIDGHLKDHKFVWTLSRKGVPIHWFNWDGGQPGKGRKKDCLAVKWRGSGVKWFDKKCDTLYCVACEKK